ncbi:LacI family DNA-binding transcriptional regulator [Sphingomonas oligophenolica]
MQTLRYAPRRGEAESAADDDVDIVLLHAGIGSTYLDEFLVGAFAWSRGGKIKFIVKEYHCDWRQDIACAEPFPPRLDGIIVSPSLCDLPSVRDSVCSLGVPVVAVAPGALSGWEMSVRVDGYKAVYEMTRHLAALGHRRIGLVTGRSEYVGSTNRPAGYCDALNDLGIPPSPELIVQGLSTYRSGLDAAEQLLGLPSPPSAVFALDDEMATAIVAVAHRRGLEVPSDLTVCGFDDSSLAARIWPALTTIHQPVVKMVGKAVELLLDAIRLERMGRSNDLEKRHIMADYRLIRRQSDAAPRRRPAAVVRQASS